eukprot:CAMPEP_0171324196 /NCGR_PEP_ID=MMETSP0816-20121228/116037_1 /TAXON_ID=420281 /ORGANISM="Proboscia inermis, Strain CCAP1064/1" /LENGTH=79 /DNA_ID=CAMNT_0011823071 /DNA_START=220 /DNA_END=459 /DNA_ORIENTATION=+
MITIKVLFFASAREAAGTGSTECQLEDSADTQSDTQQLRRLLAERYPKLSSLVLDEETITLALNEVYAADTQSDTQQLR